ncbi:EamA family transporter [Gulosibacter macacae]|nr:EamA family transporter [Gulosibacter macacae]
MTLPASNSSARSAAMPALLIIGSSISLQIGAAFAVRLFPELGSWGVNALRLMVAGAVLLAVVRPRAGGWTGRQWRSVLLLGLAMGGMNGTFYASIEHIPLGTAVAIEFIGPLLLSAILSRRARDLIWVIIAALGMGAVALDSLIGGSALDPLGVVFALVAAAFWAAYILAGARVGVLVPGNGGLGFALVIGSLISVPLGWEGIGMALSDWRLLGLAVATAILGSLLPYSLEFVALRRLPKPVFGVLMSLEPAVATIGGWLLLAQVPGPWKIVAVVLVIVASIGITLGARKVVDIELPIENLSTGPIELPLLPAHVDVVDQDVGPDRSPTASAPGEQDSSGEEEAGEVEEDRRREDE